MEIIALLQSVNQSLDKTALRQLTVIINAMLAMTDRVTMLGISRWADEGGSYRTIQRFFATRIEWTQMNWRLIEHHLYHGNDAVALAGDHTVVTKSGEATHGLGRFFSSLYKKAVPSLEFLAISFVNLSKRQSSVVLVKQTIRSKSVTPKKKTKKKAKSKRSKGRPKGSKNKNHRDVVLPDYLKVIQKQIEKVLNTIGTRLKITYFLFDGAFGNNNALQMVCRCSLHLISKLRSNSGLYEPFTGDQTGCGRPRKYGTKINYDNLSEKYLVSRSWEDKIETRIYGLIALSKAFPDSLNIAIIQRINHETKKMGHVILFSSDLTLATEKLIDYYALRFQIEFNFRDAKQFWGLEDFMNIKETQVQNAANLSLFMVNVSQVLVAGHADQKRHMSVLDLKALYRGRKYVREVLKFLPRLPQPFLMDALFARVGVLGSINHT